MPRVGRGPEVRRCRVCGCTDFAACETDDGLCHWVEEDLCSACVGAEAISFFVAGFPVPEGSTRAFLIKGRPVTTHQNKGSLEAWRNRVATEAQHADELRRSDGRKPFLEDGEWAYLTDTAFLFSRPVSYPKSYDYECTTRPDIDKILRAVNDALTGVLWKDDSEVVDAHVSKDYCENGDLPGVWVTVTRIPRRTKRSKAVV